MVRFKNKINHIFKLKIKIDIIKFIYSISSNN